MKTFIKTSCVAALVLAAMTFGAPQAKAWGWGWPVAAGVVGGVAVGTAIGATVAANSAPAPVYYTAPPAVYAAPNYVAPPAAPVYAPAPAVSVVVAPPYYYAPSVVVGAPYPFYHPYWRAGWGWGHRYFYGGHGFRR